jgi:multicomponent Na+:H+ antiporter subunit E
VRVVVRVALLLLLWLLAWGEASVGNVVSGVLLAVALLVAFPARRPTRAGPTVNLLGAVRLALHVVVQLVPSNVLVAREVVARHSRIRAGVLAYPLHHQSDELLSLMSNVIALTPGTMTVEATRDPATLYVHFLLLDDIERARRTVARLEELAVAALGGPAGLAAARRSP